MQYDLLHRCVTPQLSGCCFALLRFITTWRNEIDGRVLFSLKLLVQRSKKNSKDKRNHYSVIEQNVLSDNYMENISKCSYPKITGQNDRQDESLTGQVHDQAGRRLCLGFRGHLHENLMWNDFRKTAVLKKKLLVQHMRGHKSPEL